MKKKILTISMILNLISSFAQEEYEYVPFPTSDAIWSEVYYSCDSFKPPFFEVYEIYERFALSGEDTLINNLSYKKLYMFHDDIFDKNNVVYIGGIREDENKRIYYKGIAIHDLKPECLTGDDNDEILLYDFSKNIGDIIIFEDGFTEFLVSDIEIIKIGNTYRKKYTINRDIKWIEGIGSTKGLFFRNIKIPIGECDPNNKLICFKQNEEVEYFDNDFDDCFPTITSIPIINSPKLQIINLPNGLIFDIGDKGISVIHIFNIAGILKTSLQKYFFLNTNNYASGIYIYKATDNSGNNYAGKFIVQ